MAELQEELTEENTQIAKLKKSLAKKKQVVHGVLEKKKEEVHQAESRKLMRRLDRKESEIEQRTVQLEKRLKLAETSSQREMIN